VLEAARFDEKEKGKGKGRGRRMEHPDLVVVRTYLNRIDAELAHSALEAANIDSMIDADGAGGTQPGLWMGGVKLLVRADDAVQAREILGPAGP
jgi:hypothetical protein